MLFRFRAWKEGLPITHNTLLCENAQLCVCQLVNEIFKRRTENIQPTVSLSKLEEFYSVILVGG